MWAKAVATIGVWAGYVSIPIASMYFWRDEPEVMLGVVIYGITLGFCVAMLTADMWRAKTTFGEDR